MSGRQHTTTDFTVSHDTEPSETLLVGFSQFGLAGLTAVDYLVDHLELTETGHITAEGLDPITPFVEGRPRHPIRLYSRDDLDVTVLVCEQFVPANAGGSLSEAILDWTAGHGVAEIAVLSGVPIPHGPDDHRTYYVATDDYRERRLADGAVPAMGNGFLSGVNAALVEQGIGSPLGVCLYVTPVHAQAPDVDAGIRLLETVSEVYALDVDTDPLREFAGEVQQYYGELAERMERTADVEPEDRMYM
jgi:uncharacterized protein